MTTTAEQRLEARCENTASPVARALAWDSPSAPDPGASRAVAAILADLGLDDQTIAAAVLHRIPGSFGDDADFVEIITTMLASQRIPARMVHGFPLAGRQRHAEPITWLEVHDGDQWLYFNPATGEENMPDRFLVWWRGNESLVNVEGGRNV